jgi:hypothetical protein
VPEEHGPEDHDMVEPQRHAKIITKKRRPAWLVRLFRMLRSMVLQMDLVEKERDLDHIPVMWHCYVISLMLSPLVMKRLQKKKVWKDAMIEEYHSIIKNDFWDVVLK